MPAQKTILVINDDEAAAYIISRTLQLAGFSVIEAKNGASGIEAALKLPDAIITDVKLPDISGEEICHRLKTNPATASIPIIMVSAHYTQTEHAINALDAGAAAYLAAPVSGPELIASVNTAIATHSPESTPN